MMARGEDKRNVNTTESIKEPEITTVMIDKLTEREVERLKQEEHVDMLIPKIPGVQNPLPVCINGAVFAIPLGKKVRVPKSVYRLVFEESDIVDKENVTKYTDRKIPYQD